VRTDGTALAFQVRLKLNDAAGEEILPVFWEDNYLMLRPGETREVRVALPAGAPAGAAVEAQAWNAPVVRAR
jgi:hypothetical protein